MRLDAVIWLRSLTCFVVIIRCGKIWGEFNYIIVIPRRYPQGGAVLSRELQTTAEWITAVP